MTKVFISGEQGYHTYRIPALIVATNGTVLAFCEARKNSGGDSGDIDLVLKRSTDGGENWGDMQVLWQDGNTCGNPCPVVDPATGTVWLLLTHNLAHDNERVIKERTSAGERTVWITQSTDNGTSWAKPVEITSETKRTNWTWYATGPGVGITLRTGRLLIPCDHMVAGDKESYSHVIYSDDHGASWQIGGTAGPLCNESQIVERTDGSLSFNMRSYKGGNLRLVSTSTDGGRTFSEPTPDVALVEPVCQASILRYPSPQKDGKSRILFSNPASLKRAKMTVRVSYDEGKTWPVKKLIHDGPAAYSCLTVLPDKSIGLLFECGQKMPYETITLARFSLSWLEESASQ